MSDLRNWHVETRQTSDETKPGSRWSRHHHSLTREEARDAFVELCSETSLHVRLSRHDESDPHLATVVCVFTPQTEIARLTRDGARLRADLAEFQNHHDIQRSRAQLLEEALKTKHPRPSQDEILEKLRATAVRQLRTSAVGIKLLEELDMCHVEALTALIEQIVSNQTQSVNMWLEIAIEGKLWKI